MLYRSVYQRSSDFGRRHLRLRTISLRPYKDSVSTPFSQCPMGGISQLPPRPSSCLKSPHLPVPIPTPPYSTNKPPQTPTPLPPSTPTNSPPQSPHTAISRRSTESIPRTPASHVLRCPTESTLRVPATQGLPQPTAYREPYEALSMLGIVYTCVHKSVHACTVVYTRVYNRAFIPISF